MEPIIMSTNAQTIAYIEKHQAIKDCLTTGVINYSALARKIAKDLNLGKGAS